MNLGFLLFDPNGRIGRKAFWLGWLLIVAGNVLARIPFLGVLISFVLIYVSVCVWGKRLHDMGRTAWLVLIPLLAPFVLGFAVGIGMVAGAPVESQWAVVVTVIVMSVIQIGMLIWVGATPGQDGVNRYGPDPRRPVESVAEAFT